MSKTMSILLGLVLLGAGLAHAPAEAAGEVAQPLSPPTIAGSGEVGSALRVTSLGSMQGSGFTYTWLWDGEEEPGPGDSAETHRVTAADLGHELSVLVKPDGEGERLESNRIAAVDASLVAPGVEVTGTAVVKGTLTARFTSPGTAGADVTVAWTRDDVDIPGASSMAYDVQPEDAGHAVRFRTTTTAEDGRTLMTSVGTRRIGAWTSTRPTFTGTARVGRTQTMRSRGAWSGDGYRYTYRWLRDGSSISRATRTSYRLTTKDRGRRITLRVTATKPGWPTVRSTSTRSAKVR